jgi:uncharacterized protein DUF4038/collagenase-like protein with putative collagen-binding domain
MKIRWICSLVACVAVTACAATPIHYVARSKDRRYLLGMDGLPFLIAGDSPQPLIVNLSTNDADTYFADRQSNGFNTVWINLICTTYTFGNADGSTYDGILPFTGYLPGGVNDLAHYDLSKPNEAYFERCDQMLELANKHGLVVMLDPLETGGWTTTALNNGANKCRAYGHYVGKRYKNFPNIVWINGSDDSMYTNRTQDADVAAVAQGIKGSDNHHIQTIELKSPGGSLDDPRWASIVRLNAAYTYNPTYAEILRNYQLKKFEPVFLVEANYDAEPVNPVPTEVIRQQEYWTDLSGATGQLYGSDPTVRFASGWQSTYDTPGAIEMAYVGQLFGPRAWYNLIPDTNHVVVTEGYGTFSSEGDVADSDYLTAGLTPDGTLMIAYMPTVRQFTVDMTKFTGSVTARWYDPTNGSYMTIDGSPMSNTGTQDFLPPGNNNDGDTDWVLVLETQPPP